MNHFKIRLHLSQNCVNYPLYNGDPTNCRDVIVTFLLCRRITHDFMTSIFIFNFLAKRNTTKVKLVYQI